MPGTGEGVPNWESRMAEGGKTTRGRRSGENLWIRRFVEEEPKRQGLKHQTRKEKPTLGFWVRTTLNSKKKEIDPRGK